MRTKIFFAMLVVGLFAFGCNSFKEKSVQDLLLDQGKQNELFDAILSNHEYTSKLVDKMMMNENSKKVLTENNYLAKMVCMSEKTDTLFSSDQEVMNKMTDRMLKSMRADSVVCDKTCTRIMENDYFKNYFKTFENKIDKK